MDATIYIALGCLIGVVVGGLAVFLSLSPYYKRKVQETEKRHNEKISLLEKQVEEARNQEKSAQASARNFEKELKNLKVEIQKREERLIKREELVERKAEALQARENEVAKREKAISLKEKEVEEARAIQANLIADSKKTLEQIAGMTQEEARKLLTEKLLNEVRLSAAKEIKQIEEEAKEEAEKRAKRVIGIAIGRYAGEFVSERTVSVVSLPNEEMKGRIIGREGRNIRAFEAVTGVDVIIDDTPDTVILSAFNPIRREIARASLEKLVSDGRIHPARIEDIVEKTTKEVDQKIKEAGEEALFELSLGPMHPELVKMVGCLKYRMSYAQNVLTHSIECGFLCGLMAAELGMSVKEARRAGLLHDIGKAIDHKTDGPHALVGANFARKYGESAEIVHAIAAHHEEEKPLTVLAHLVMAADALSGARPGARKESLESYVKRLQDLEEISNSFEGVERTYAIQAGREVRVIVSADKVPDEHVPMLAKDIAKKIEEKLAYPGQIKVCVIRETRAIEYAK